MHKDVPRIILILFLVILFSGVALAEDTDGSTVVITAPQNGDVVGSTVDLKYELKKGTHGDHVHVYVDGTYQKDFKGTLTGLAKGTREVTVKVANAEHDVLAASATVTLEVK